MTRIRVHTCAIGIVIVVAASLAVTGSAQVQQSGGQIPGGQMSGGQGAGHDHGAMQGAMQATMSSSQMMVNINAMMASVTSTMRGFTSMPAGMFGPQHDQMVASVRGITDQMHQLHAAINDFAKNPTLVQNNNAMKTFNRAGTEFQKMGAAFQNLMKNLDQTGKDLSHGGR